MIDYREGRAIPSHGYCRLFSVARNILAAFLAWHDDFQGFLGSPSSVSDAEGDGHLWWLRKEVCVRETERKLRNMLEYIPETHGCLREIRLVFGHRCGWVRGFEVASLFFLCSVSVLQTLM